MTVGQLRMMPQAEFLGWAMYHARRAQRAELAQLQAQARRGGR